MSTTAIELPLFPLDIVLFPGTTRPLHIFEPRYRQMILDCKREDKPFGIVLTKPESMLYAEVPHAVGTMAEMRHVDRLPDGRYTLVAMGTRRFRIVSQHHHKPYLSGLVEPFEDEYEPEALLAPLMEQASRLFNSYLNVMVEATDEEEIQTILPNSPEALSHFIAYILDMHNEAKQRLLEMTLTRQRLIEEITILRREVPFMRQILFKNPPEEVARLN